MESYNSKFARAPARDLDLHRPLDGMNQLGDILCWRETRRVSQQLVVHYNRMKFTRHPSEITARLVGQAVEVYDFPDGRLEIRWKGLPLAYAVLDKLQRVRCSHRREQTTGRGSGLDQGAPGRPTSPVGGSSR